MLNEQGYQLTTNIMIGDTIMDHTATAKVTMNVNAQCVWEEITQEVFAKAQFNVHRNGQLTQS